MENGPMKLGNAKFIVAEKLRAARNLDIAINKPKAERLIRESTEEENKELIIILESLDKQAFDRWCHRHSSRDIFDKSICEIREIAAKKYFIPNAKRIPIEELRNKIADLIEKEK